MRDTMRPGAGPSAASSVADRFADFYRFEYDRAVRLAWLLTGSHSAAEDVVQDAMTGVYRSFERLTSPAAYLRSAVVNRARSRSRNEQHDKERVALLQHESSGVDVADAGLFELIARLPYRQRVVIVARYWGGWSEADIAGALGCRRGTVKSLASRALEHLRREVDQ